jgi:hypothetical protein
LIRDFWAFSEIQKFTVDSGNSNLYIRARVAIPTGKNGVALRDEPDYLKGTQKNERRGMRCPATTIGAVSVIRVLQLSSA